MSSNIRAATNTNVQYELDTAMPDEQLLCSQVLTVAAGTSGAVFTLPAGSNPIVVTKAVIVNKTAVTGANTVAVNVNGAVALTATAQGNTAVDGVSVNRTNAATQIVLRAGQTVTITQAVGTAGTIAVSVYGTAVPNL